MLINTKIVNNVISMNYIILKKPKWCISSIKAKSINMATFAALILIIYNVVQQQGSPRK
ncbi:hypothetical protein SAMN05216524_101706 [Mucilaginibacter sp. OK098]|nr:hypothetical protein SAMN05216524_101706 [Mucilaginibacter sp. OK098]